MRTIAFLLFGTLFGFFLSRVGATDPDAIFGMFRLTDLQLFGVIGVAIALAAPGLILLRRTAAPAPAIKARKPGNLVGGLIFGAGWALSGACPGTVLAQIGEGRLMALCTLAGVLLGTALHLRYGAALEAWLARRTPARATPAPAPERR